MVSKRLSSDEQELMRLYKRADTWLMFIGMFMNFCFSNWRRTAPLIFFLALLTRGAFILMQQDGFYFPDSLLYSEAAVNLLAAGEFGTNFDRAPGYSVFVAAVYLLFGESIFAIRVVESFAGAFLAVILAALGRRIGGEMVGALAGVIWAVYPMGIFIAGLVYPTSLATILLAGGVWCLLPAHHEELSVKGAFSSGLFFGLAALAIPVVLLTIVAIAAWVFYWARHARLFFALLIILGSAVTLVPWTARNFVVYGEAILVQPNFEQHLPRMKIPESGPSVDKLDAILLRFDRYAARFGRNFVQFWELYPNRIKMGNQDYRDKLHARDSRLIKETIYVPNRLINAVSIVSTVPIFLFALLGTVAMCLRRDLRRELSMLWIMAMSFAVGYSFFVGKIRYRIPVEPYLIILSAYGMKATFAMIPANFKSFLVPSGSIISRRSTDP
jgi:4-amino-4-deoxy-L-arabinose transferase-like glycosyltransferase